MTIPEERVRELRELALAAAGDDEPLSDAAEISRQSVRLHMAETGTPAPPDRPEIDLHLHGRGVQGHEIPARSAGSILIAVQETVASIGQAVTHQATLQGSIQARVVTATELLVSADISAGSVVFRLLAPGEQLTGREAAELTGTDTLVDAAMAELIQLIEQSSTTGADSSGLAQNLRSLGPRTAKHLSELIKQVITSEIDIDFSWRNPAGQRRNASLNRAGADALQRAIQQNRIETREIEKAGVLDTISVSSQAVLITDDGRITLTVDRELAETLGPYFNRRVIARIQQVIKWSTSTGRETKRSTLLSLRIAADDGAEAPGDSSAT